MKVVHINKYSDGGAAWCAMRISHALQQQGVESKMLFMHGTSCQDVAIVDVDWLYRNHGNILIRLLVKLLRIIVRPSFEYLISKRKKAALSSNAFFTSPVTGYTNLHNHPWIQEVDIVHLHWVADFVDFPTFFRNVKKPIVWTIHDENPGLGGFHYISHKKEASPEYLELDRIYGEIKRKACHRGNVPHLVAISSYMQRFFEKSPILKDCPVTLIHNGVDCDAFHPLDKKLCRKQLGIEIEKKVFLFSSYQIEDKRKGLQVLIPALEALHDSSIELICLGNYKTIPTTQYISVKCVGLIKGNDRLSAYYSASDYFVLSSFQEAFAQTPLESLACGTPVIAFPCSGIPDLLNEKIGVMSRDFTEKALTEAINVALKTNYNRKCIRKEVASRFSYNIIAKQYIKLYNRILNEKI